MSTPRSSPPTPAPFGAVEHPNGNRLLTADEVAARWQVPKSWVYAATREGRIPTVRLGRYYRYRVEAVEAFERDGGAGTDV